MVDVHQRNEAPNRIDRQRLPTALALSQADSASSILVARSALPEGE